MSSELIFGLYVFALSTFVGYQVISRVPALLHTPLALEILAEEGAEDEESQVETAEPVDEDPAPGAV
jgi:hypothetical protein